MLGMNMVLNSTFRCMCSYGFRFEAYINMAVFVACFNFSVFDNDVSETVKIELMGRDVSNMLLYSFRTDAVS